MEPATGQTGSALEYGSTFRTASVRIHRSSDRLLIILRSLRDSNTVLRTEGAASFRRVQDVPQVLRERVIGYRLVHGMSALTLAFRLPVSSNRSAVSSPRQLPPHYLGTPVACSEARRGSPNSPRSAPASHRSARAAAVAAEV